MLTTVVFVHGFRSGPECWKPFCDLLKADPKLQDFRFLCYSYSTGLIKLNPLNRIPTIKECGNGLGHFLDLHCPEGRVVLVGHSMGGLVIQYLLAEKLDGSLGTDLARIRSVILFATPNRGSDTISNLRRIAETFIDNPQEAQLKVLDAEIACLSDTIVRGIVEAKQVDRDSCPIPFVAFWGENDAVVPEASARGPFTEASKLPGNHETIIQPVNREDDRYLSLQDELLNPVGHPFIYEFDCFEVNLTVSPNLSDKAILLSDLDEPFEIQADNIATRSIQIQVSAKNRCSLPYEQEYRSIHGYVESLSFTGENRITKAKNSENSATGRKFTYTFIPNRAGTFALKLRVYNGFGEGQRSWHNHMNPNAHYKLFRFTLDLQAYENAGYLISPEPRMGYCKEDIDDHEICKTRGELPMVTHLPAPAKPSLRAWELTNIYSGVIDISWDIQKPASTR